MKRILTKKVNSFSDFLDLLDLILEMIIPSTKTVIETICTIARTTICAAAGYAGFIISSITFGIPTSDAKTFAFFSVIGTTMGITLVLINKVISVVEDFIFKEKEENLLKRITYAS